MHHSPDQLDILWAALKSSDPAQRSKVLQRYSNPKLAGARTRLVLERPFVGALAMHLALRPVEPGRCATFGNDARSLYFNPEYVAALDFAQDRLANQARRIRPDVGHDWKPLRRRGVDLRNVAHAGQGHIKRARDGRGSEGKDIHFGAQLFEVLLVGDAKALFFIDDHQAEIPELDIRL